MAKKLTFTPIEDGNENKLTFSPIEKDFNGVESKRLTFTPIPENEKVVIPEQAPVKQHKTSIPAKIEETNIPKDQSIQFHGESPYAPTLIPSPVISDGKKTLDQKISDSLKTVKELQGSNIKDSKFPEMKEQESEWFCLE